MATKSESAKSAAEIPLQPRPAHWFQPGQSGNPTGKTRKTPLTDALMKAITKQLGPSANESTLADALAAKLLQIAGTSKSEDRALEAIRVIFDRLEGRPLQRQEIGGSPDGVPIQHEEVGTRQELERKLMLIWSNADKRRAEVQGTAPMPPKHIEAIVMESASTAQPAAAAKSVSREIDLKW